MFKLIYWIIALMVYIYLYRRWMTGECSVISIMKELIKVFSFIKFSDGFIDVFMHLILLEESICWPICLILHQLILHGCELEIPNLEEESE